MSEQECRLEGSCFKQRIGAFEHELSEAATKRVTKEENLLGHRSISNSRIQLAQWIRNEKRPGVREDSRRLVGASC